MKLKYIHIHMCFIIVPALPSAERSCFSVWSSAPALFISASSISLLSLPSDFPKSKPLKNCLMAEGCSFLSSGAHFFPWNCFITKSNGERFWLSSSCPSWQFWTSFRRDRIRFSNVYSCLPFFIMVDALRICHRCLHPATYHSHDTSVQEQSTYNHKKLRDCLKFGINVLSQLYSLEIQKLYKPMYLDVHAQLQLKSCFPWLWFPVVEALF